MPPDGGRCKTPGKSVRLFGGSMVPERPNPPEAETVELPNVVCWSGTDPSEDLVIGGGLAGGAAAPPILAQALPRAPIPEATAIRRQVIPEQERPLVPPELDLEVGQQDLAFGEERQQDPVGTERRLADGLEVLGGGEPQGPDVIRVQRRIAEGIALVEEL